ncbi:MAG: mucoidy inhibitor MuiA family protein, partial [Chitinophagia bacterium]|nr:mucoidy inhibitor MuiA family protein [Chitinophagia bacterium]
KEYHPGGLITVKFYAKEATTSNIAITYVVPDAGWSPVYDISADGANGPVTLFYKANVHQNSGVLWPNVRLTLSTGNPQEGMQMPVLQPWYLAFYTPAVKQVVVNYRKLKAADNSAPAAVAYGSTSSMSWSAPPTAAEQASVDEYVVVNNSGVNTEFDIDLPYTIPADGQQHLVAVKKYEVAATYSYFTAPKADKDAFLEARLTSWEDLNLLPGPTNIFYEGSFLGNGAIDPKVLTDTMNISLGRDKKIVVKRELDKQYRSVKMIGSNVREQTGYNITVRNTRKETVTVEVADQLPVSNDKDIEINDKEFGDAAYDETTGMLKWHLTLKPNESKKLHFGYTLKYPKGKIIANK